MRPSRAATPAVVGWDWDRALARTAEARPRHGGAQALAISYSRDERSSLALLLLPFVLLAFAMGITQTMKTLHQTAPTAHPPEVAAPVRPPSAAEKVAAAIRATPRTEALLPPAPRPLTGAAENVPTARPATAPPAESKPVSADLPALASSRSTALPAPATRELPAPSAAVTAAAPLPQPIDRPEETAPLAAAPPLAAASLLPDPAQPVGTSATAPVASAAAASPPLPGEDLAQSSMRLAALAPMTPYPEIAAIEAPETAEPLPRRSICEAPAGLARQSRPAIPLPEQVAADRSTFGARLAAAAETQTGDLVVYTDRYRRIAYPMGDVSPQFGVCTDVVVRAYRTLGLDLQALVQQTRSGSGDASIDHRRVETLRRFFSTHGVSLRPTDYAEDYKPGDIVTYYRPQNRHSKTHIAMVSEKTGPSGRPMIVHNRGWGPQIEDGLFVDQITGHYRFSGLSGATSVRTASGSQADVKMAAIPAPKPAAGAPTAAKAPALGHQRGKANPACVAGAAGAARSCPVRPTIASAQRTAGTAPSSAR
jgi:uncharacterized protein YijF (DUF1287 family)